LTCKDCGKKGHHVVEDREQEVVKGKEWEELKKYEECARERKRKVAHPTKGKVQPERGIIRKKSKELSKC